MLLSGSALLLRRNLFHSDTEKEEMVSMDSVVNRTEYPVCPPKREIEVWLLAL